MNALIIDNVQIRRDGDARYCLNDLHQASGGEGRHRPSRWLENKQTKELIAEIEKDRTKAGIPALVAPIESAHGGAMGGTTYAVKELVYAYATWISAKFFLHVIRAYDAMVTAAASKEAANPASPYRIADATVGAARSFMAILRICRAAGRDRVRALRQANKDTVAHFGVDLLVRADLEDLCQVAALPAADAPSSAMAFGMALLEGQLDLPIGPALSIDVAAVYNTWCTRNGWRAYSTAQFVNTLNRSLDIHTARKHYFSNGNFVGPHSVMFLGADLRAVNQSQADSLGIAIAKFKAAANAYIGSSGLIA